jgi:heat shock protein HslJ
MLGRVGWLAIAALSWGCSGNSSEEDLNLAGRSFVSESVEGYELVPGTKVNLQFGASALGANAGCNSLDFTYAIQGATLVMSGWGSTAVGCDPARHAQDDWLQGFMLAKPSVDLEEPRLVLATANAKITLVDREVAIPDRPLVGPQWLGDGYSDGNMVTFGVGWDLVSIHFDPAGSVQIETGCQTGTGTFQVSGSTVTFGGLTYAGDCSDHIHEKVAGVLDGSPVSYEIDEQSLELHNGILSVLFRTTE